MRSIREPLTYADCVNRWAAAPKRQRDANLVRLAPNTWLASLRDAFGDGDYVVVFHVSVILTFFPDGSVRYSTGGHRTATTKARLNRFGPASVWSKRGTWLVEACGVTVPYFDGFVHPGRPAVRPENLTASVRGILANISATGDWSITPILADAFQEAGGADVLATELRSGRPGDAIRNLTDAVRAA